MQNVGRYNGAESKLGTARVRDLPEFEICRLSIKYYIIKIDE